ncbi:MAG: hypothetical protein ACRD0U_13875 [Acidimicrobiales bacterium]
MGVAGTAGRARVAGELPLAVEARQRPAEEVAADEQLPGASVAVGQLVGQHESPVEDGLGDTELGEEALRGAWRPAGERPAVDGAAPVVVVEGDPVVLGRHRGSHPGGVVEAVAAAVHRGRGFGLSIDRIVDPALSNQILGASLTAFLDPQAARAASRT